MTKRDLLEMQGYCGLDDRAIVELDPWLRFNPALCAARITRTGALPRNGATRRFACAFAALRLTIMTSAFGLGAVTTGRVLGAMFVAVAMVPVLTGFCLPSFLFQSITRRVGATS